MLSVVTLVVIHRVIIYVSDDTSCDILGEYMRIIRPFAPTCTTNSLTAKLSCLQMAVMSLCSSISYLVRSTSDRESDKGEITFLARGLLH